MNRAPKLEAVRPPAFGYRRSDTGAPSLFCEQVDLAQLAVRHGTPLYVYSAQTIRARLKAFDKAFRSVPHTICYSVKANSTLGILRLVAQEGAGFDVVSGGEIERIRRATRKAETSRVVFSGVGKTVPEMELALKSNILLFNVESASELRALAATAARLKKRASIALRVNPDVSAKTHPYISTGLHQHKFGVPIPEARQLYAEAAAHPALRVAGASVHIGSQIADPSSFSVALERVAELVGELRRAGHAIQYVDVGGGLAIPYQEPLEPFVEQIAVYATAVIEPLRKLGVHILLEPGRSIVGPAGVLVTRVVYRKKNNGKRFLIVDAAMNDLLRPSLYSAYHDIVPLRFPGITQASATSRSATTGRVGVAQRFSAAITELPPIAASDAEGSEAKAIDSPAAATEMTDLVGPICETGDFFARDRELPIMREGDLLAILDTGAYGMALASNYNTRGRPAEVLVDGKAARLIRKRETTRDQLRLEGR